MSVSSPRASTERMASLVVPKLPPKVPARIHSGCSRWFGRTILRLLGWQLKGEFPDQPKVIVALAPHTSNWDFIIAMAAIMATGIKASYLMKKEAFVWPFSKAFKWLGGIPLNRKAATDTVDQIVEQFERTPKLWLGITPEGTRGKVAYWRSGFLRIAHRANVPVLTVCWDFAKKEMVIDRLWWTGGDFEQQADKIRAHVVSHYQGRYPECQ